MSRIAHVWLWLEHRAAATTQTDARSLSIGRILFGLSFMSLVWPSYTWLGSVPDLFFDPPIFSVAGLLNSFPPRWFFVLLDGAIAVGAISLTLGFRTRWATLITLVAYILGQNFNYAFGKIGHDIMIPAVLFVMLWQPWGAHYSLDARRDRTEKNVRTDLRLLGVLLVFGFFTAGYPKLVNWIDFDLGHNGFLRWLYLKQFSVESPQFLLEWAGSIRPLYLFELFDIGAVVFELGFLIVLFTNRRGWIGWLTLACLFHLLNTLILNVPFYRHVLVYPMFLPLEGMFGRFWSKHTLLAVGGGVSVLAALRLFSEQRGALFAFTSAPEQFRVPLALGFWVALLLLFAWGNVVLWRDGGAGHDSADFPPTHRPTERIAND